MPGATVVAMTLSDLAFMYLEGEVGRNTVKRLTPWSGGRAVYLGAGWRGADIPIRIDDDHEHDIELHLADGSSECFAFYVVDGETAISESWS